MVSLARVVRIMQICKSISRAELKRVELVPKVCKGKSMHSANALLCSVCRECGDTKVLKCDE